LIRSSYPALASSLSGSLSIPEKANDPSISAQAKEEIIRSAWTALVAKSVRERWVTLWRHELSELSSLRYYRCFKQEPSLELWLKDTNHAGIHPKLLLRCGKLLNTSHPRPADNRRGLCRLCNEQAAETRSHFLLSCPALEQLRQAWIRDLRTKTTPSPSCPRSLSLLLEQWAATAHIDLAPSSHRPSFPLPLSHSTVQICALLRPSVEDIPLPLHDASDEEQVTDILKTRRAFETLLEKSTRILLHKMTKHRKQLTGAGPQHPMH
jgi:hypothetical protein